VDAAGTIVLCRCARWPASLADTRRAVLAGLEESGAAMQAVADLCELAARQDPALKRWAAAPGLHVVACHPRAVRWLFAAGGAPLAAEGVAIHNMRLESAEAILAALGHPAQGCATAGLARPCGCPEEPSRPGSPAVVRGDDAFPPRQPGQWVPWFPVIDYERCKGCRQCLEFCLFGVYALEGDTVRVAQPDHCKTGCPACARVCPHSAIIFPKYKDGPISGDEGVLTDVGQDGLAADLSGLSPQEIMMLLRRRSAARRRAAASGNIQTATPDDE